jgi:hypothetical protein
VLTGGLMFTRKTTSTVRNVQEDSEQFLLLYSDAGLRLILAEQALEFSGLGLLLQPARTANVDVLAQELRRRTTRAFHDDRLLRLGRRTLPFVLGGNERRSFTRGTVDVLAEVLDQAVRTGLLHS